MPNQSISLSNYDPEAARIQRQMRLAEMLQQQAMDPLQPVSPNAPISPLSVLGKVLQAYGSKRNLDKADTDYADLQTKRQQQLAESLQNFGKSYKTVDAGAAQAQEPGGEPLQQYAMAQPTQEQKLLEAIKIGNINTPGAQDAGSFLMAQNTPKYTSVPGVGLVNTNGPEGKPSVAIAAPEKPENLSETQDIVNQLQKMPPDDPNRKVLEARLNILTTRAPQASGGSGVPRFQQSDIYITPDGKKVKAVFNPQLGQSGTVGADGKFTPLPEGSRPTTAGVGNPLNRSQYFKLKNDFRDENTALGKMNSYFKTVGSADVGMARMADQIAAKAKTLFGSKTLTPEQLAAQVGNGQLQGLLGLFRVDVVGPGVMTEYDAQRVLNALGGDFTKMQNPAVVKALMQDIYADKMRRIEDYKTEIDFNSKYYPGDSAPSITAPATLGGDTTAPQTATEADIQHTMQARKMTRQQVLDKLKERGISVAP